MRPRLLLAALLVLLVGSAGLAEAEPLISPGIYLPSLTVTGLTVNTAVVANASGTLASVTAVTNGVLISGAPPTFSATPTVTTLNTTGLLTAGDALTVTTGALTVSGAGPHAIGGATNADIGLLVTGTQPTGAAMGVQIDSTTTPATGESSYGINLVPTLTEFSSGVHALLSGINVAPTVTAGAGTVTTLAGLSTGALTAQTGTTNAAAIYVSAAPTGATNNNSIWVAAGATRLDGLLGTGGNPSARFAIDFGSSGSAAFTSSATSTSSGGYLLLRPASVANTSGTGDLSLLSLEGNASLNPTGASTTGAALRVSGPLKGGAGTFTNMAAIYISDAPTGGTNNYSLWVDDGNIRNDGSYLNNNVLAFSSTAPTVSGFCTSPSVPANNGTIAFTVNVGTSCTGISTGTITLPAATTGWVCQAQDVTTPASFVIGQTGGTTTTATVTNYGRTTGLAVDWTASEVIRFSCSGY